VQEAAEAILTQAAAGGADLGELAALAEEIRARTARPDTDADDEGFANRSLFLESYYRDNGFLRGDLTPPAAAALRAVLDALNGRTGPDDLRSKAQRDHDALEEACRLLLAARCLPDREGQPVQIQLQMTLSQLLGHAEADPALAAAITARGTPAPPGADCDARIVPVVTGTIDHDTLAEFASSYPGAAGSAGGGPSASSAGARYDGSPTAGEDSPGRHNAADQAPPAGRPGTGNADPDSSGRDSSGDQAPGQTLGRARRAAAGLTIADALRLLSGPGGLAARLRSRLPGPAGSISLPLDIGAATDTIPVHLRRAITRRDHHCRFPGCDQPPVRCHVHHLRPRADGGDTSITNCLLLCSFHHLIAVHRWGWQLRLNPDGTTTAVSPDGTKTLHSHPPPRQAA
jgi:hypothetical protein